MMEKKFTPKKRYKPALYGCQPPGRKHTVSVKNMTRDELEQALCKEIHFTEEVLLRLSEIREASHRFGWAGTW